METMNITNERGTIEIDRNLSAYIEKLREERTEPTSEKSDIEIDDMERG